MAQQTANQQNGRKIGITDLSICIQKQINYGTIQKKTSSN